MPKGFIRLGLMFSLFLTGCATAGKSTFLAGVVGSVVGGSLVSLVSQNGNSADRTKGVLIGATVGGTLGALIGYESHKEREKKKFLSGVNYGAPNLEIFGSGTEKDKRPNLRPAQVRVRYVEDQVKDGVFIPAHFEYEIAEPARWER